MGKLVPKVKLISGLVGTKADAKTVDTAFGRIEKNKLDISNTASTSSIVGTKTDSKNTDTAFGRIEKDKSELSDVKETTDKTVVEKVYTLFT